MKILVTGAAGFIGSHLCEELLKDKTHDVIGIDDFIGPTPFSLKFKNLEALLPEKRFTFIKENLLTANLSPLLEEWISSFIWRPYRVSVQAGAIIFTHMPHIIYKRSKGSLRPAGNIRFKHSSLLPPLPSMAKNKEESVKTRHFPLYLRTA